MAEQDFPRGRHLNALRAADEDRCPEFLFELAHLSAERALRDREPGRGFCEAAMLDDAQEVLQLAQGHSPSRNEKAPTQKDILQGRRRAFSSADRALTYLRFSTRYGAKRKDPGARYLGATARRPEYPRCRHDQAQ